MRLKLKAGDGDPIGIGARVVWNRVAPHQLRSVRQGGIGLRINNAPETYFEFLMGLTTMSQSSAPQTAEEQSKAKPRKRRFELVRGAAVRSAVPAARYRVRVRRPGTPHSRSLLILDCASDQEARRRALREVGEDWAILELDRIENP